MIKRRFTVVIEKDEDGIYVASVPELPGCHTQANHLDELDNRIKEAIKLYLEVVDDREYTGNSFIGIHEVEVAI
jgi:predicted RNase H-like HicB family nuclease